MKILTTILSLTLLLICTAAFSAQDGFNDIQCGTDIPKSLIGHHTSNEKVVAIENRHKNLGLKDLWSEEISDRFSLLSWMICGGEYFLLEDKHSIVRDVLKFPEHSKQSPQFMGACEVNGKSMTGTVLAVLKNEEGVEKLAQAFQVLEQGLEGRDHVGGKNFTMGDIPLGTFVYRWNALDVKRPKLPGVEAYYRRLQQRPAYRKHVMLPLS